MLSSQVAIPIWSLVMYDEGGTREPRLGDLGSSVAPLLPHLPAGDRPAPSSLQSCPTVSPLLSLTRSDLPGTQADPDTHGHTDKPCQTNL